MVLLLNTVIFAGESCTFSMPNVVQVSVRISGAIQQPVVSEVVVIRVEWNFLETAYYGA